MCFDGTVADSAMLHFSPCSTAVNGLLGYFSPENSDGLEENVSFFEASLTLLLEDMSMLEIMM